MLDDLMVLKSTSSEKIEISPVITFVVVCRRQILVLLLQPPVFSFVSMEPSLAVAELGPNKVRHIVTWTQMLKRFWN